MPKVDNDHFYSSAIKNHGIGAKGLNWNNEQTQRIRFKAISQLLPKPLNEYTLLDAGCGFADLYEYLLQNAQEPKEYIGADCHKDMVSIASLSTGHDILNIDIIKNQPPQADFIVCSGALNTLSHYESFLFIQNCFLSANISFIFNVLHGTKQSDTYNYMQKKQIELFANKLGVKKLSFIEGYLDADITVRFDK
jgi:SAM-dependent methyltransferase